MHSSLLLSMSVFSSLFSKKAGPSILKIASQLACYVEAFLIFACRAFWLFVLLYHYHLLIHRGNSLCWAELEAEPHHVPKCIQSPGPEQPFCPTPFPSLPLRVPPSTALQTPNPKPRTQAVAPLRTIFPFIHFLKMRNFEPVKEDQEHLKIMFYLLSS